MRHEPASDEASFEPLRDMFADELLVRTDRKYERTARADPQRMLALAKALNLSRGRTLENLGGLLRSQPVRERNHSLYVWVLVG